MTPQEALLILTAALTNLSWTLVIKDAWFRDK